MERVGMLSRDEVRDQLLRSVVCLVEAVCGPGAIRGIGYLCLASPVEGATAEHNFYVVVPQEFRHAVIGKEGRNAERIRELVKTRLVTLRSWDRSNLRIAQRDDVPPSAVWFGPEEIRALGRAA